MRSHLKLKQRVACPYEGCNFQSNVYSTFNAHKSKVHGGSTPVQFKTGITSNNDCPDHLTKVQEEVSSQNYIDCEFEEPGNSAGT